MTITFGTSPVPTGVRSVLRAAAAGPSPSTRHRVRTSTEHLTRCSALGVAAGLLAGSLGTAVTGRPVDATLVATAAAGTAVGLLVGLYRIYRSRADSYERLLRSLPDLTSTEAPLPADALPDDDEVWSGAARRPVRPSYEDVRAELGQIVAH